MILDVGCGSRPRGDVNIDISLGRSRHHRHPYDPLYIQNFVQASAEYLPFRAASFRLVICRATLEHLRQPLRALIEFDRASWEAVAVMVPMAESKWNREHRSHIFSWTRTSLRNILRLVWPRAVISVGTLGRDVETIPVLRRLIRTAWLKFAFQRLWFRMFGPEIVGIVIKR